jgi:hypothetical protein
VDQEDAEGICSKYGNANPSKLSGNGSEEMGWEGKLENLGKKVAMMQRNARVGLVKQGNRI